MTFDLNKEILRLAAPAIVSNITTPLLGLVDTAITGHMGAPAYIGAIAIGGSMFSLAYWVMNFLRIGTSGLTSQAYGAQLGHHDSPDTPQGILAFAMVVSLALSFVLILASPWIASAILYFMDADAQTTALAGRYFQILIFGAPAVLGTFVLSGWFLGMQDSKTPMWMALVTNVVNILISLALVYGFGLKIEGVAIGTLIAQYAGFGLGIAVLRRRYGIRVGGRGTLMDRERLRRFFGVNIDIFFRTLCLAAVTLWFTHAGAQHGADILAANAILMQLFILFSYFMDGFAFAGEAMAGKYTGMRDLIKLRATIRGVFLWGAIVAVAFTALYALGGNGILHILTDDASVVECAQQYMPWVLLVPAAGVAAFVWDGIFIGMTLTRQMLVSMLVATATFFTIYITLGPRMGNHGLWLAFVSYLLLRGLTQTLLFRLK